jgi:cytochrome c
MLRRFKEDAEEWVEKAVTFYKNSGKEIALAEFSNPTGHFIQGELYIFVMNPKGTMLAHGVNERFVGQEFADLKDVDGKSFIKEILKTANTAGSGWVKYKWNHPTIKVVLPKTVFFKKVDDLIICSGIYELEPQTYISQPTRPET